MLDLAIVRTIFVLVLTAAAYFLHPFAQAPTVWTALAGFLLGGCIIFFEVRLEQVSLKRLIGAAFGSVLGIIGAFLMSLVLRWAQPAGSVLSNTIPFLQVSLLLWMTYVGMVVGALTRVTCSTYPPWEDTSAARSLARRLSKSWTPA